MIKIKYCLLFFFFISSIGLSKVLRIELNELTTRDDGNQHIIVFKTEPNSNLILPITNIENAKYFEVFYTRDIENDPNIDVMLIPKEGAEELFVDINNDEDLTNDGPPLLFKFNENSINIDIVSNSDPDQKTRISLLRQPDLPDSLLHQFVDENGNLQKGLAKMCGPQNGDFNYKGEKGTFYFYDRVTVRRGQILFDNEGIQIGIYDYSNNGLYTDDEDLLIVDLDRNNKLNYYTRNEVFKLSDIFTLGTQNFKINRLDKYGKYLELIKTDESATFYYLKEYQKQMTESSKISTIKGELDQSFWELSFETLSGKEVKMLDYKGKNVLLNFWGEWCKPCITEIPDLIELKNKISSDKFEIISFAKSSKIDLLKKIISEKEMDWTHILLPEDLSEKFKISGYPTNILILSDTKTYWRTHTIDFGNISSYIQ